ncbi:putative defective in cullin neddylation protein 1 [Phaeomoniella chlamydospora]|uniref:Defective in cullin neddylation protein n=1 Tax=Phaeomoniella chlamydospora TaxID=158046 RepID=A0A0G2EDZ7_PHACM|nr:putative defective in cullin neddylation protein 1 [Phaeomoniella chlamydospora]
MTKRDKVLFYARKTGYNPSADRTPRTVIGDLANIVISTDSFYQSGQGSSASAAGQQALSKLFDKYRDDAVSYPDRIGVEGISSYLEDLSVRPDEVVCLGLMELLNAPTIGELHRKQFIDGWLHIPPPPGRGSGFAPTCETIPRQEAYAKQLRSAIQTDEGTFRKIYRYTFNICRPEGQRNVPAEVATEMWRLFFSPENGGIDIKSDSGTPWLDWWIEYYEAKVKRPVNKDLWNMFGEMVFKIQEEEAKGVTTTDGNGYKAGFGWWSEEGAWPGAVDEFVEWVAERRKGAGVGMDVS